VQEETTKPKGTPKPNKKVKPLKPRWLRIVLGTLKIISIPAICVLALIVGLWIGYAKLGHQPAADIFHLSTWKHLIDLVFAD
jgi:hypothetical protein